MTKQLYTLISIFVIALYGNVNAQFPHEGRPLSWTFSDAIINSLEAEKLSIPDVNTLLLEDDIGERRKEYPYRFAEPIDVHFDLENSGRWIPLGNGDRVWVLIIESQSAYSLAATVDHLKIPSKAKLYVYNSDHSEFIGGFTKRNTENDELGLPHLSGEKIYFEYYEPYEVRGKGKLTVSSISYAYKEKVDFIDTKEGALDCYVNASCDNAKPWQNQISSVVRITVDNSSRYATGTLVNTTSNKSSAYVITSMNTLIGNPDNWVFSFNYISESCKEFSLSEKSISVSGAEVIAISERSNLALLKLKNIPNHNWNVYYSGWDRSASIPEDVLCVHHSHGALKKASLDFDQVELVENADIDVYAIDSWESGSTLSGSIGSPLFNSKGLLVGVFSSGDLSCENIEAEDRDYFVSFSECWEDFKSYLDPKHSDFTSLLGRPPSVRPDDAEIIENNIAIFPNPAKDYLTIYNDNEEIIEEVRLFNSTGKLVLIKNEIGNTISLQGLPSGMYFLEINLESFSVRERLIIQ